MADPTTRSAARIAALVAVPVALAAGLVTYRVLDPREEPATPVTATASPRPQSSTPVDLPASPLTGDAARLCRAFTAALPDHLADLARRPVVAGADQNAAYGDPPVTVVCGVVGASAPAGAQFFQLNGVCWYAEQRHDNAVWTLRGRGVPIAVTVPSAYTGQYLVDLSKPIADTLPAGPSQC